MKMLKFTNMITKEEITFLTNCDWDDENNMKMPPEIHGWIVPKTRRTWTKTSSTKTIIVSDGGDEQESIKGII